MPTPEEVFIEFDHQATYDSSEEYWVDLVADLDAAGYTIEHRQTMFHAARMQAASPV